LNPRLLVVAAIAVTAAILLGGLFLIFTRGDRVPTEQADTAIEVPIGGPFTLVNGKGETVTEQNFLGKYLLVFFGFTYCADICPTTLDEMGRALEVLGPSAAQVTPIFISVDPDRDTPEVVGDYVAFYDTRIVGLTGTQEQVEAVRKAYKIYAEKRELEGGGYAVDHSGLIIVMGPDGKFRGLIEQNATAASMAARVTEIMKKDAAA
jgi:protein SCO1/2